MKKMAYFVMGIVATAGIMFGGYQGYTMAYDRGYEAGVNDGAEMAIEYVEAEYAKYDGVIEMYDKVEGFKNAAKEKIEAFEVKFESLN